MAYTNSKLVSYTRLSPNYSARTKPITKITIHHAAVVNASLAGFGNGFAQTSRQASSNYAIDSNGKVGMYVEEKNRAWTSSNAENDQMAVTIEVANSKGEPNWEVSNAAYSTLLDLCEDICRRNGIKQLKFTGDKTGNLTMHKYFAATGCPGPYLESKFKDIANEVNKRLNGTQSTEGRVVYRVQTGSFSDPKNAENQKKKLQEMGFKDAFVTKVIIK